MKPIQIFAGAMLLVFMAGTASADNPGGLEGALRQVVEKNLTAYNAEDISGTLASVHTKSPVYANMRDALPAQFGGLDVRSALVDFTYVGHDDEFAYARVKYRSDSSSKTPFVNNVLDTLTIFHQEDGAWKYWDNHILGAHLTE